MSTTLDLVFKQGEDKTFELFLYDGIVNPANKLNLAGYTATMLIAPDLLSAPILTLPATVDVVNGSIRFGLSSAATNAIAIPTKVYSGVYQVELTSGTNITSRVVEGQLLLTKSLQEV